MRSGDGITNPLGSKLRLLTICHTARSSPRASAAWKRVPQIHKAGVGRLSSILRISKMRYHLRKANRFGSEM